MTRDEFDGLPSNGRTTCPDCGLAVTHPNPGCGCGGNPHINRYHHTCKDAVAANLEHAIMLARKFQVKPTTSIAHEQEIARIKDAKDHWHRRYLEIGEQLDKAAKTAAIEGLIIGVLLIALIFFLTIR